MFNKNNLSCAVRQILRCVTCVYFLLFLNGCSMPVGFSAASWVIDGASYITTKKSLTDHGLSFIAGQDCALYRLVTDMNVCQDYKNPTLTVMRMVDASDLIETKLYEHHMNEIFYGFDLYIPPEKVIIYGSLKDVADKKNVAVITSELVNLNKFFYNF